MNLCVNHLFIGTIEPGNVYAAMQDRIRQHIASEFPDVQRSHNFKSGGQFQSADTVGARLPQMVIEEFGNERARLRIYVQV